MSTVSCCYLVWEQTRWALRILARYVLGTTYRERFWTVKEAADLTAPLRATTDIMSLEIGDMDYKITVDELGLTLESQVSQSCDN